MQNYTQKEIESILKYYFTHNINTMDNFQEDFNMIKTLKASFTKLQKSKTSMINGSLNKVITLLNLFGLKNCKTIFFKEFKRETDLCLLKTFLIYLNYIKVADKDFLLIKHDEEVLKTLMKL